MLSWLEAAEAIGSGLAARIDGLDYYAVPPDFIPVERDVLLVESDEGDGSIQVTYDDGPPGRDRYHIVLRVLTNRIDAEASKRRLMDYRSRGTDLSIYSAVRLDRTFGGLIGKVVILRAINYGKLPLPDGTEYQIQDFDALVEVY